MQKRAVFHVSSLKDGKWVIKKKGVKKPIKTFSQKGKALIAGKRLAKKKRPGQLVVHKKSGKIQIEYTYGADPRRFKG